MFKWLTKIFKRFKQTKPTQELQKKTSEREIDIYEWHKKTKLYVHKRSEIALFREKIKNLIDEEQIEQDKVLFVSFYISKLREHFSDMRSTFLNPWTLKSIKERAKFLKYKLIAFDEFCDDPNGIFRELITLFWKSGKIVIGMVNAKEFESESYKKFKRQFPTFVQPSIIEQELNVEDEKKDDSLFSEVPISASTLNSEGDMGGLN